MREREEFEAFWSRFPRKTARGDAWKAWQQTRDSRPTLAEVLAAVDRYIRWRQQLRWAPELVYPSTWLRQERWADEGDTAVEATKSVAPIIDPDEQRRREQERMDTMRARAAWGDVTGALVHRSMPLGGWPDPRTAGALERIGSFAAICRSDLRGSGLREMGLKFERAYLDMGEEQTATSSLRLVRSA